MSEREPRRCRTRSYRLPTASRRESVEQRWSARYRRRAGTLLGIVILVCSTLEPFRTWTYNATPVWVRHFLVSQYTRLLPDTRSDDDLRPIANTGGNPYGINVFLEQEVEEAKIRRSLEMIRDAGFGWIRQQMVWAEIEVPQKGSFVDRASGSTSWVKYDRIVRLANEYGIKLIFRIDTSPEWARPGLPKLETPPANFEDYADFAAVVASRYRGKVDHFQIWNEPNIPFEWGYDNPDAVAYTRMLKMSYRSIKDANPEAVILSAALAPTTELSENGINELIYLQSMYDAGVRGAFDILGANAYGLRSGPNDRRLAIDRDVNFSRPQLVRRLMVQNGDSGRPIWIAEVGWNSLPEEFPAISLFGRVDRGLQASYTVQSFQRAQSEWPWVGVLNLWHFRLVMPDAEYLQQYFFSAVDEDFTTFPLYKAMYELTRRPLTMHRGFHSAGDRAIEYVGIWDFRPSLLVNGGRGTVLQARGSRIRVPFDGTSIALVVLPSTGATELSVLVDGAGYAANKLDRTFSGPARLRIPPRSGNAATQFSIASALPSGRHWLDVELMDDRPLRLEGIVVDDARWTFGFGFELVLLVSGLFSILTITLRQLLVTRDPDR